MDYLARVELHGDRAREDYVLLQAELAKAKFYTTVLEARALLHSSCLRALTIVTAPTLTSTALTQRSSKPSARCH
jgi:hypothetical protein